MTKEEFEQCLKGFWAWAALRDRPKDAWLYSLEEWLNLELARNRKNPQQ